MKLETFFEKFDLLAGAPGAVEKMRELVLQLAVRGRLVQQSPHDVPASELSVQIAHDRASFVKARGPSRQRAIRPVPKEDFPFDLPSGWLWTRLGDLCRVQAGFAFASAAFQQGSSGVPVIRIRDITNDCTQANYVGEYREEFLVEAGDYLVGMDGNFRVAKWRGPRALLNQRVSRLQWYSGQLEPSFFAVAAQYRLSELQGARAYTTVDHLSSGQIENAIVPLPPLAEQKRIVAKVDELMALCDQLEAQQQERETRHAALARASLARFSDSPTPANLEFLFHKSYDIAPTDLRKSILRLAVQGRLVRQDPNDEPAIELLGRLVQFKLDNPLGGRSGRSKEASEDRVDMTGDLPATWAATTIGEVLYVIRGASPRPKGDPRYFSTTRTPYHWVKISDIRKHGRNGLLMDTDEFLTEAGMRKSVLLPKGTLVLTNSATIGVPIVLGTEGCCIHDGYLAFPNFPHDLLSQELVLYLFRDLKEHAEQNARGLAQLNLNSDLVRAFPFGLPPLAEQRRIVAKVSQLMALVDELEMRLSASRSAAASLLDALVAELMAA